MRGLMLSAGAALLLAGCASTAEIGIEPVMSPVVPYTGASMYPGHYDLKAASAPPNIRRNSLWDDRQSRLFTDPRALTVGDILTVAILINDRAQLRNQSERRRTADRSLGASASVNLEGFEFAGEGEGRIGSGTQSAGRGETQRSEDIRLRVAAVVMDVLPNGNLVIRGSQEVRVNAELRILNIEGIVLEPAGALAVDVLRDILDLAGKRVVCICSGGNFDFERLPEVKERAQRFSGLKRYFILRMPQRPGALRDFLQLLGPEDDIARFEYLKKSARNFGSVLIGIETTAPENLARLCEKLEAAGIGYRDITRDPVLAEFLI